MGAAAVDFSDGHPASIGLGVVGARSMVARRAVLPAIDASERAHLVAAASLGGPVPDPWSARSVENYDAVIDHPDVDAVYVPLPNGMHEHWVRRCAAAGKHVLCEKPLGPTPDAARRMQRAADTAGVLLAEAWMTPFDPRWAEALRLASTGLVGRITEIRSAFTFTIGPDAADNYRWDPAQGGGALLDVGIYCLGPAVRLWGPHPDSIDGSATMTAGGVDATSEARLTWPGGEVATIRCSFVDDEVQRLELVGTDGSLTLDGDAHTGGLGADEIILTTDDGTSSIISVMPGDPYLAMVDAFAGAVAGSEAWDRPATESIAMSELIDRIAGRTRPGPTPSAPRDRHDGHDGHDEIDETPT